MDRTDLQNYEKWIGKSPDIIRGYVVMAGGWSAVFPKGTPIPKWLHRVRNFFNELPKRLVRVSERDARHALDLVRREGGDASLWGWIVEGAAKEVGASGDVYKELNGRYWIEMSQMGSRYHSEEQYGVIASAILPHSMTGNFKLISPDGTGGSTEIALQNWRSSSGAKTSAAPVGQWVNATTQAITKNVHRGSYNFADTMVSGFSEHERFDMDTDAKYGTQYVNEDRWKPIGQRVFARIPEIDDDKTRVVDPKMAGLPLSYDTQQSVIALDRKGKSVEWIAKDLDVSVEDVRKIIVRVRSINFKPDMSYQGFSGMR